MKYLIKIDWLEFENKNMCSLCANWGYIDTRGLKTPAGFECGKLNYCICHNGRQMKKLKWDIEKEINKNLIIGNQHVQNII
jgi:hypothetical protein